METRRSLHASSVARFFSGLRTKKDRKSLRNLDFRSLAAEPLEERQLLAITLLSLIPNEGADISGGGTLNVAPREFTFKFTDGQIIDPNSLLGIRIRGSGGDGVFGDPIDGIGDDIDLDPLRAGAGAVPRGFVGIGNFSNEVVLRFAETLPDDLYQIIIIGDSTTAPADPLNPLGKELQNTAAEPYNLGANTTISLNIDRGTQIVGVVPQPVRRVAGGLQQDKNLIEVYFNRNDPPNVASAETEAFYDLIFTNDTATTLDDVYYTPNTATWMPTDHKVVLDFNMPLDDLASGAGTYRLRVGNDAPQIVTAAPVAVGEIGNDFTTVTSVGTLSGVQSTIHDSAIDQDFIGLPALPGANSDPGNRELLTDLLGAALNSHGGAAGGGSSVSTFTYNFRPGPFTNSAGTFFNNITENQKQRTREIMAIYSYYTGIHFIETASSGTTIMTGDMRASDPLLPPVGGPAGISGNPIVMNETLNYGISEFGGSWFTIAMHEIGHNLGLGHAYELTNITIQGDGSPLDIGTDPVFPGDHDLTHVKALHRPDIKDIDLYQFQLNSVGKFSAETIAERLASHTAFDQLDSLITLYEEIDTLKVLPTSFATLDGKSFTITDDATPIANTITFIFDLGGDTVVDNATTVGIDYLATTTQTQLAEAIAAAINGHAALRSDAKVDGTTVKIQGLITLAPGALLPLTHTQNVRDLIARNDDYYSEDSFLELRLDRGIYYVAVTASGNDEFDPEIANSGNGGRSQGNYSLRMNFVADTFNTIVDDDGTPTQLDGDGDGRPGGLFNFWFKVADEVTSHTIFVDKAEPAGGDGSEANPFNNIPDALARLAQLDRVNDAPGEFDILRLVGNPGNDSNLATPDSAAKAYEIGFESGTLEDGIRFDIPRGVTTMVDAGAIFKLLAANITAGSTAQGVNRSEGHLQVLGTPSAPVFFTSYYDETTGEDSPPSPTEPGRGDWGGLVFRNDLDYTELNIPSLGSRRVLEQSGIFLNYVNGADLRWGGGQVSVNSQSQEYQPIYMDDARPTITHNTITNSAHAAMSADPFSFTDEKFQNNLAGTAYTADYERVGPHIHDNRLATYNATTGVLVAHNSLNGLFVRIRQDAGTPLDSLTGFGRFDDTDITHILQENLFVQGTPGGNLETASRLDARLKIDPGTVVKLEGARIEVGFGAQLLAEGTDAGRVVFTSLRDDNWGFGGTYDTNGNFAGSTPNRGDWGGIFFAHTSTGSIDHAHIAYGGGSTRIEGGSDRFNVIEIHQSDVRIVNSTLQNNDDGTAASSRVNRQGNAPATIFVRGSQPTIVNNVIRDNDAVAININVNSLRAELVRDAGRSTGVIDTFDELNSNYGPLVRLNRLGNNDGGNGMNVRGGNLNIQSVWDDTDIVHILTQTIQVVDLQHYGGLRLQSSETESLVVKLSGATTAGFQATGLPLDVNDRVGGTIHIVGTPQFPVVMTSLADDTVGAGFNPIGQPMLDTNDNGASTGAPGQWRSVRFDKYANDRNSAVVREVELPNTDGVELNATAPTAQFVGTVAKDQKSGDDNRRLGIEVQGTVAWDDTTDVDVYSFRGTAGSEVWLDIDFTTHALDTIVELVLNDGLDTVVARSDGSFTGDTFNASGFISNLPLPITPSNPSGANSGRRLQRDAFSLPHGQDFYTTNPRDAGMRVVLPGLVGSEETYFVRVRSNPVTPDGGDINNLNGGASAGAYSLQIRTRELDEFPGSTIRFADMRFGGGGGAANSATIELWGVPYHSFLTGESREASPDPGNAIGNSQNLGNLLQQERNTIGFSGALGSPNDIDFVTFGTQYLEIQSIGSVNASDKTWSTVLDVDYADGLSRSDTNLAVFNRTGSASGLIYFGADSNISDDLPDPLATSNTTDLSRGSFGTRDPFIGPIQLPTPGPSGTPFDYRTAVSSNTQMPTALNQFYVASPASPNVRLEPINSVNKIAEDRVGYQGGSNVANQTLTEMFTGTTGTALSTHVVPFRLSDVTLFVNQGSAANATNGRLFTVDPFTGDLETDLGDIGGGAEYNDIELRDDGRLVGLRNAPATGNAAPGTAGNLDFIDTGNATITNQGDDGIDIIQLEGTTPAPVTQGNRAVRYEAWAYTGTGAGNDRQLFAVGRIVGNQNSGATGLVATQTENVLYRMNPNTGVADQGAAPGTPAPPSQRQPISGNGITGLVGGTGELITGMEFLNNVMYVATNAGRLYTLNTTTAVASQIAGGAVVGPGGFNGLTKGPRNVESAAYRNLLFTISSTGLLRAYNVGGGIQAIFDTDGNGVLETSAATGITNAAGLSFSNVDYNLWHFTDVEPGTGVNATQGHGIGTAPDNSTREDEIADNGANGSFYFGLENNQRGTTLTLDLLTTQPDSQHFVTGNPAAYNTYNVPGGAHGALRTNSFSLEGYASEDKPTLYFTYFLQTQGAQANGTSTGMRDSARVHISTNGGTSWQMIATNNSANDPDGYNPPTMILTSDDSELPEFKSWSADASDDPRQRIQELFDSNNWRQAHIDLGEYAGLPNLMLRFDFSTAGDISDPSAPPTSQYSIQMDGDAFGNFNDNTGLAASQRGQNNAFRGFHVDDIIIGAAERGEMVLNAPGDVLGHFQANVDPTPDFFVLNSGEYQLEIRRGPEYGNLVGSILPDMQLITSYHTNDRMVQDFSLIVTAPPTNGQSFVVSDGVNTVTFNFTNTPVAATDISTSGGPTNITMADRITTAINSAFTAGLLRVTAKRVASSSTYNVEDPRIDLFHAANVLTAGSPGTLTNASGETGIFGFGNEGDRNHEREQGMVKIEQNRVTNSASYAITLDEGARDNANNTPHPGAIHHLRQLNIDQQWVPSAVVENNVISGNTVGGILVSGDPGAGVQAVIPFARILNNTIFGAAAPLGVGIDVTQRASPTILNNIVSNLQTGVRIDTDPVTAGNQTNGTVMQGTVYKNNTTNTNTGSIGTGSFAILMNPGDPLFVDPLNGNFYLAPGSQAIDSSIESLPDRPELVNIYTAAGISQSNILAPDFDQFGNKRVDDPSVSPVALGLGANVFIDRGALERVNTLTINDVTVVEGNSGTIIATFTVTLTRTVNTTVTVEYNTTDGDAVFGADYLPNSGTLTFLPGQTTQPVTVVVNGDVIDENNELFFVNLFNETNAVVSDVQGSGTINDDDALPSVSVLDASALEGDVGSSPLVFSIVMTPPSGRNVVVNFNTAPQTAIASPAVGADYTTTAGAVTFSPGEGTKFVTVQIIGDATVEPNETFFLNLTGVTNATIGDNQAVGTIQDNDLKISISDGVPLPVTEPNAGTVDVVFSVTLSGISSTGVSVVYTANTGTGGAAAVAGLDFQNTTGTLVFVPGDVQEFVTVRVVSDLIDELNENFSVDLTGAVNAAIQDGTGVAEIVDDAADGPPTLGVTSFTQFEGDAGLTPFVFQVTLNVASGKTVTVNYTTTDGTAQDDTPAVEDDDYIATAGVLTFDPGVTVLPVTVQVRGNTLVEPNETFTLDLFGQANALLPGASPLQGTATIRDDEPIISVVGESRDESFGTITFNVVLTLQNGKTSYANDIVFSYVTADGPVGPTGAVAPGDYTAQPNTTLTFLAAFTQLTHSIVVPIVNDSTPEQDESFFLNVTNLSPTLANPSAGLITGTGVILDNEAKVSISPTSRSILENTNTLAERTFNVTLDKVPTNNITVTVSALDGTATTANNDYSFSTTSLFFAAGTTVLSQPVTVTITGDAVNEPDETFTLNLSTLPAEALVAQGTATITIVNDDATPLVSISAIPDPGGIPIDDPNDSTVLEGDAGLTYAYFLVSLDVPSGQNVTVNYATANNTAVAGSDFTSTSSSVTIAAGTTTALISVAVTGDTTLEPDETFFVNLLAAPAPVNAVLSAQTQAVGSIVDDEPRASVSVVGGGTVAEGGTIVFQIVLDKTPSSAVVVTYNTANGTALAGFDYTATAIPPSESSPVTFTAGSVGAGLTKNITIQTTGDAIDEFDETFTLNISGAANLVEVPSATATILDPLGNEPTISIQGTTTGEGDSATTNAVFIVSLSAPSGKTITVQYATSNLSAQSGLDYNSATGTLTFDPLQTQKTITVQVLGDLLGESDETYSVDLLNPTNASGTPSATGTIVDNEPVVNIANATVLEGNGPGVNADFVVTLNKPSDSAVQVIVTYATTDGVGPTGATGGGVDFTSTINSTLTFSPGQTVKSLLVPITGDLLNENDETFTVGITSVTNARLNISNATGTIVDNDPQPELRIFDASLVEGNSGAANMMFRVTLTPASGRLVSVNFATANDTPTSAAAGGDYGITVGTLNFPIGVTELFVAVPVNGDTVGEPNETFLVDLLSPTSATLADSQARGTILDDEPRINISSVVVNEADGQAVFTVVLAGTPTADVSVGYSTANNTAAQPGDYTATAGALTFTFSSTETVKQIIVPIVNDLLDENSETFFVNLSSPSLNAVIGVAQGVGTINDNDNPPSVTIQDVTVTESNGGTVNAVFDVFLNAESGLQVLVPYSTADGTATLAGNDYFAASGTVTFAPGETSKQFTVQVRGDTLGEPNEQFVVNLGAPTNAALADPQGQGTISDDEPRITITGVTVVESDVTQNAVFTVNLVGVASGDVTVVYTTNVGTATAADFTAQSGTLTFLASLTETVKTIIVPIVGDQLDEADETFFVSLSTPSINSVIGNGIAGGLIQDDDETPNLTIGDVTVTEGNVGTVLAVFPVILRDGLNQPVVSGQTVTVLYSTADGLVSPATAGSDYQAQSNMTLVFSPGQSQRNITVVVNGELNAEPNETFVVNLFSPSSTATIADAQGVGTILDDEPRVSVTGATVTEGDAGAVQAQFLIQLDHSSSQVVSVVYSTGLGVGPAQATAGLDYTGTTNATVVFSPGETVKNVLVPVLGDLLDEDEETFSVQLNSAVNAIVQTGVAEGRIVDNDALPILLISDVSVAEGNAGLSNAIVNVSLSAPSGRQVTVAYTTADGTATLLGADYGLASGTLTFAAGEVTQPITIPIVGDNSGEPNETFAVNLSVAVNAQLVDSQGVVTIVDDEPRISILDPVAIAEGATDLIFEVRLDRSYGETVTVAYSTANASAAAGLDYTATSNTLTFNATVTSQLITVPILGDFLDETNETFFVNLAPVSTNAVILDGQGQAIILDDDAAPTVSIDGVTVTEGNALITDAVFRVHLNAQSGQVVQVPFSTANGTATVAGSDYNSASGVVTFAPGITEQLVTVQVRGDVVGEPNETLLVNLSTPVNAVLGTATAVGTILDDEPRISIADATVVENDTTANLVFTVTLTSVPSGDATVAFNSVAITAGVGVDFTPVSGVLTFSGGVTQQTFTVAIAGDLIDEADETFQITLSGASSNAVIADGQGIGVIQDNDAAPNLSIGDMTIAEGNSGSVNLVFPITLSMPSGLVVTVVVDTVDGTATGGVDYTPVSSGVITFNPGETRRNFTVQVAGDNEAETNETLLVDLSSPLNAGITDGQGLGTIIDDEPIVSIDPVTVTEANGDISASFLVRLDRASTQLIHVLYSTTNGSAVSPADYTSVVNGTVTFQPGQVQSALPITVRGDLLHEASETFSVTLTSVVADNANLGAATALGTILNDDALPSLTIGSVASITEGNAPTTTLVTFPVTLSAASGQTVTVVYTTQDSTATSPADYVSTGGTLTFSPGQTTGLVTVQVNGDQVGEPNETFLVQLQTPVNASVATGQTTATIVDDEPRVAINDVTVSETESSVTAVFSVTLIGPASGPVLVAYDTTTTLGSATPGGDYQPVSGQSIEFLLGETSKLISLTVFGDSLDENNETFFVNLTAISSNAVVLDPVGQATIVDNDPLPLVSISDATIQEGDAGSINLEFDVILAVESGRTVTVNFSTAPGTALAGSDFTATSGVLTFGAGSTLQKILVPVVGNLAGELDETFSVSLSSPVNAVIDDGLAVGTIQDNDPRFTISDAVIVEGDGSTVLAMFSVQLTSPSASPTSVLFATAPGTALAGLDYQTTSGSLSFAAGATSQVVTVQVLGDLLNEDNETFLVNLSSPVGTVIFDNQGVGLIQDNDPLPQLAIASASVIEGDSGVVNAVFNVTLTPGSGRTVNVAYSTSPLTAAAGTDYSSASGTLTFLAGQTVQQIMIQVNGDLLPENNESFEVLLNSANNALINTSSAVGTIVDNEPRISIANVTVTEPDVGGNINAVFNVTIDRIFSLPVSVNYVTAAQTANDPQDYQGTTGATLTIPAGSTLAQITVPVVGDALDEANETFDVVLSAPVNGVLAVGQAQGTILDNDPGISINSVGVVEVNGGTLAAIFSVTLTQSPDVPVTVAFATSDVTAVAGSDYTGTSGVLSFAVGQTTQLITVSTLGDLLDEDDETFNVVLSGAVNGVIQQGTGVGTIQDNDLTPQLQINSISVVEGNAGTGGNAVFGITLSAASGRMVTFEAATVAGTATAGDFTAVGQTLTFNPGESSLAVTVPIVGDALDEPNETFSLNLFNPFNVLAPAAQGLATIVDDDPLVSVADPPSAFENVSIVFGLSLNKIVGVPVIVSFATADVTATAGLDYIAVNGTLTFSPGETTKQITVTTLGDPLHEANETFDLNLSILAGGQAGDLSGRGTILDNDPAPTLSLAGVTLAEGNAGLKNFVFTATLSAISGQAVTAAFATAANTANAGGDFQATSGTLTIPAGQTTGRITVQVISDTTIESDESFFLNLTGITGATPSSLLATGQISNDDASPIFVTGADAGGGPHVRVWNSQTGTEKFGFYAYNPLYGGGVRVAAGDVNGDAIPDIATVPGSGGGPHLKVLDGRDGQLIYELYAFESTFSNGLQVAMADFNGDGRADVIVGTDGNSGDTLSRVRVFDGPTGALLQTLNLDTTTGLHTGVRVAAGDINNDGRADLILSSSFGVVSRVRVIDAASLAPLASFQPYGAFPNGVYVASGDTNGDGTVDVITGAGPGGGPHVRVFNGANLNNELAGIYAYHPLFSGGVRVAATDYNGDGLADVVTAAGPGGGPHVKVLSGAGLTELVGLYAYSPIFGGGVNVGGSFRAVGEALHAAGGVGPGSTGPTLTHADVVPLVQRAIADWAAAGLDERQLEKLREIDVRVADLPGDVLGLAHRRAIVLDSNAAGHGWFIDETPWSDEEFEPLTQSSLQARAASAAARGMDLLTVIAHELGHTLGLEDISSQEDPDGLMTDVLDPATRRMPAAADIDSLFGSGDWD